MISKESTLPEVISTYPATRAVFDGYGLKGCGGALGPSETVEFFARVHKVPLEKLLAELEAAKGETAGDSYHEDLGDVLYKRHFRAAVLFLLFAGATLGAAALFLFVPRRSTSPLDLLDLVLAHGDVQVFGWIGLFVMGFACQGLPRFKFTSLWRPRLAANAFVLVVTGLVLRAAGGLLLPELRWIGFAGTLLIAAAVTVFAVVIVGTLRTAQSRDVWDRYVLAALLSFVLSALFLPIAYLLLIVEPAPAVKIARMSLVLGPHRDLELLGFAALMILGVGQRILPAAFGFREVPERASARAFLVLATGLLLDLGGWLLRGTFGPAIGAFGTAGGVGLFAAGCLWLVIEFRGFTGGDSGRSTKFIRAAFVWLAIACIMMLAAPGFLAYSGLRYSHAYQGALRHALTVGFMTLMIAGVSLKVVPVLRGLDLAGLPSLWPAFILVNGGNVLRVGSELLSEFDLDPWLKVTSWSGPLTFAGLLLFALHLLRLLSARPIVVEPVTRPDCIDGSHTPASVIRWYPYLIEVFEAHGFSELRNPILRNTIGRRVTLKTACSMKKVDLAGFLAELNAKARVPPSIEV